MKYQLAKCKSTTLQDVPIVEGQIVYVEDTGDNYLDTNSTRLKISDIIFLDSEAFKTTIVPTLNKLYFIKDSQTLQIYNGTIWEEVVAKSVASKVSYTNTDLSAVNVQDALDEINNKTNLKITQTTLADKLYGTDEKGNQTVFDKNSLNKVDDVQVDGTSIVKEKIANIDLQSIKSDYNTQINSLTQIVNDNKNSVDNNIANINTVINNLTDTVNNNKTITDNNIKDINTEINDIDTNIQEMNTNINTNTTNITNLSNTVNTNTTNIENINTKLNDLNDVIDGNKTDVDTNITNLQNTKLDKTFANNVNNNITAKTEVLLDVDNNKINIKSTIIDPTNSTIQETNSYLKSDEIVYVKENNDIKSTIPKLQELETSITSNKQELQNSINTVNTNLTQSINDTKQTLEESMNESNQQLQESINTNSSNITQLQQDITTNEENIKNLQTQINTNKEDITTAKTDITGIKSNITDLQTDINTNTDNISSLNTNISNITNDITNLNSRVTNAENNISTNTTNISNNTQSIGNINTTLENQADSISVLETQTETNRVTTQANTVAIQGLVNQFDTYHHYFQGYYEHTSDIEKLEAERGDYAYNGETNTIWAFDTVWSDTFDPIPSDMGGKTQTTPLMDGEASVGTENYYAAGDHVHPTDITRASVEDLTAHTNNKQNPHSVTKEQIGLGNVDNTSDINKPVSTAVQTELDLKQNITDNTLLTSAKQIPNSINELYTSLKTIQDLISQTYFVYKHNNFEVVPNKTVSFQLREFVDIDDAMIIDENYAYTNSKNTYRLLSTESNITELGFCSNGWIGFTQNGIEYVYLNQKFMEMFARELGMTNEGYQGDGWYKYTMSLGSGVINMDFEKINYTQLSGVQTMKISSITEGSAATPVTSINSNDLQYIANFIKIVE